MGIYHFQSFSVFLAIYHVLHCVFLIFKYFQFSRHTPGPTLCISHLPHFWVFLAIFQVLQCVFLIFHVFRFSCHIPGPTVCFSQIPCFLSVSSNIPFQTVFVSFFPRFSGSLQYSRSQRVQFSFSTVFSVIDILQVIYCLCLIFHVFSVSLQYSRS